MRRRLFIPAVAIVLAVGAFFFLLSGSEAGPESAPGPERSPAAERPTRDRPAPFRDPGNSAAGSSIANAAPAPAQVSGRVVDERGRAAASAIVVARGPRETSAVAGKDGDFLLRGLIPGEYTIFASAGARASVPLGPVPLGSYEELREVVLVLEAGAALSGMVLDGQRGGPVAGATVSAGAASATADERGRYRLSGLPAGIVAVRARAEGYLARSFEVEVSAGRERAGADVHLERAARVFGKVFSSGGPVGGVTVQAALYGFGSRGTLIPVATNAPDGTFSGWVPAGHLSLVSAGGGYAETRSAEFEIAAGEEREVNLTLSAGGTLFGTVRSADGAGVPACSMTAVESASGRRLASSISGPAGQYWLAPVPQGIYQVVATCQAGRAEAPGARVADGDQVGVDLTLGSGSIAGRVVDWSGKAVAGAAVGVRLEGSAETASQVATSRADGSFEAGGLAGQRFTVSAAAAQGSVERAGVPAGARDVLLMLGSGELVGQVTGERGEPVADFVAYAEPLELGEARPRSQRFVSPGGEFRLSLAPGLYALRVSATGYVPGGLERVVVRASAASERVRVALREGASIRGRVVDEGARPLEGVRVATNERMLWAFGRAAPVPSGAFAISDSAGAFVLFGVASGERAQLFAYKEGLSQKAPVQASAGKDGDSPEAVVVMRSRVHPEGDSEFGGVGMSLGRGDRGEIFVADAYLGGPAREAGVRSGDLVVAVDAFPVAGLDVQQVVTRIRGQVGTPVLLAMQRAGKDYQVALQRVSVKF